jgi:nucleoside-diphosphate-sugar epimerase
VVYVAGEFAGKTVLVTGATGFLGGALARRLATEGAQVKVLARRPQRDRYIKGVEGIEIVSGDITDANRMLEVVRGCDYVFHAAAVLSGRLDFQRKINVDGTCNLMRAAGEAKVQRVVHVSTIAVYGYGYTSDVSEDTPQKPGRVPYNVTKSEAETVVREVARDYNLSYSIIRPGMIYGPRSSGWTVSMFKLARRKPAIWLGDGGGCSHPIYIDDVVDLTLLLATHPAADGEAFNCAPDPAPSWREFLGAYSQLAGHLSWFGIPIWLARIVAPPLELFFSLRGEPQDLPTLIPFLQRHKVYKMTKAKERLGWQPKVSLQEGIQSCVPYLREKGLLR